MYGQEWIDRCNRVRARKQIFLSILIDNGGGILRRWETHELFNKVLVQVIISIKSDIQLPLQIIYKNKLQIIHGKVKVLMVLEKEY